jgi:hypothetical protein
MTAAAHHTVVHMSHVQHASPVPPRSQRWIAVTLSVTVFASVLAYVLRPEPTAPRNVVVPAAAPTAAAQTRHAPGMFFTGTSHGLWDEGNRHALEGVLRRRLRELGVTISSVECHMRRDSREFACRFEATAIHQQILIDRLRLTRSSVTLETPAPRRVPCPTTETFGRSGEVSVYQTRERRPELPQFVGLSLYVDEATGIACIESTVGYG